MAKSFSILRNAMSKEARAKGAARTEEILKEISLRELRQTKAITQEKVAEILDVKQANISKLENRDDMYVSTLSQYITAIGGELEITARFPDEVIRIGQFKITEARSPTNSLDTCLGYGEMSDPGTLVKQPHFISETTNARGQKDSILIVEEVSQI